MLVPAADRRPLLSIVEIRKYGLAYPPYSMM